MSYSRFEGFFKAFDHTQLFYQSWTHPSPKASVVITHGQGEHSECYSRLINFFEDKQINFYSYDLRGHGRSEGLRGYSEHFENYVKDNLQFYDLITKKVNGMHPLFLLGHSMGGLIQTLSLLQANQSAFQAQILSAPLFGLAVEVPALKKHGAQLIQKLFPKLTLGNEIDYDMLTRDPEILREYEKDTLRHDRISSGVYLGFVREFESLQTRVSSITIPSLLVCAEKDPIVDSKACELTFSHFGSSIKKSHFYGQEAKHELFNDIIRNEVFGDVGRFLDNQIGASK